MKKTAKTKKNVVRKLTRAKIKDGFLSATYTETDEDAVREIDFLASAAPHPDLEVAFDACAPAVREIIMVGERWAETLRVTSVKWSRNKTTGVAGVTFSAQAKLETASAPWCFNTVHLPFSQMVEGGNEPIMPQCGVDALEELEKEVLLALDGKSAQGELFEEAA